MTSRKTLSVIIPVYFNADSLPGLLDEISEMESSLAEKGLDLELIFVNDGSGDNSLDELLKIKRARPATKVISLSRNFGAVSASKTGLKFVTGDAFIILAADLQDPPAQLLLMVDKWLMGAKLVISARAKRGDPWSTRMFAIVYYWIVRLIVTPNYPKGGFDLMLMDRALLPYIAGAGKNTNPNMYAYWLGFKPVVLAYERRERVHGRSRWTFKKKLNFFLDTIAGFSVTPIRAMSAFGALAAMLGFILGLRIFIVAATQGLAVPGFAALAVLITFFSGMILLMLGILGEYLWRTFDAVNNKPEAIIDETFL